MNFLAENGHSLDVNGILLGSEEAILAVLKDADALAHGGWSQHDPEEIRKSPCFLTDEGLCFLYRPDDAAPPEQITVPFTEPDSYLIHAEDIPVEDPARYQGYQAVVERILQSQQSLPNGYPEEFAGYSTAMLYDLDGNGVKELLALHLANADEFDGPMPVFMANVWTLSDNKAVPLLEDRVVYYQTGFPQGFMAPVKLEGQTYLCIFESSEETGGRNDDYYLYRVDGVNISEEIRYSVHTHYADDADKTVTVTRNGEEITVDAFNNWLTAAEFDGALQSCGYWTLDKRFMSIGVPLTEVLS